MTYITPTEHERAEWARMAHDAYRTGRNCYGTRYSVRSALGGPMAVFIYDTLMRTYRTWLVFGWDAVENDR